MNSKLLTRRICMLILILVTASVSNAASPMPNLSSPVPKKNSCEDIASQHQSAQSDSQLSDEEQIKEVIAAYFTLKYESRKLLTYQDTSMLIEDNTLDWAKKEKNKQDIEIYTTALFNTLIVSYSYSLNYISIEIDKKRADVKLSEDNEIVTLPDYVTSKTGGLLHSFTLHKKQNRWVIYKHDYEDELSDALKYQTKEEIIEQINKNYEMGVSQVKTDTPNDVSNISATYNSYNATLAKNYADTYWNTQNPPYYMVNPGLDCANFVSQSMYAGMGKTPPDTSSMLQFPIADISRDWYYSWNNSGSSPWVNVPDQYNFLTNEPWRIGPYGTSTTSFCSAKVGDVVQYYDNGGWAHEGIIVIKSTPCIGLQSLYVDAHTTNHYHMPLIGWSQFNMRYILINGYKSPSFADVPTSNWAINDIEQLYYSGYTSGCGTNPLIYCPTQAVTRAQMAVFLLKGIHGPSYNPPPVGSSTGFTDVPTDYWAAAWIKELALEGITGGCGYLLYCPDRSVTHAEMAVFLLRSAYGSSYQPYYLPPTYTDIAAHWARDWITNASFERFVIGAVDNCPDQAKYCPDNAVLREEKAGMLIRTFNIP